jgi:hypothetical protein
VQRTGVGGDPFLLDRHGVLVLLPVAERFAALVRHEVEQIGAAVPSIRAWAAGSRTRLCGLAVIGVYFPSSIEVTAGISTDQGMGD